MRGSRYFAIVLSLAVLGSFSAIATAAEENESVLSAILKKQKPYEIKAMSGLSPEAARYAEAKQKAKEANKAASIQRGEMNFQIREKRSAEIKAAYEADKARVLAEEDAARVAAAQAKTRQTGQPGMTGTGQNATTPVVAPENKIRVFTKKPETDTPRRLFNVR